MHHPGRQLLSPHVGGLLIALCWFAPSAYSESSGVAIQWERHPAPAPQIQLPDIASEVAKSMEAALARQNREREAEQAAPQSEAEPDSAPRPTPRVALKPKRAPIPVPEDTVTIRNVDDIDLLEQTLVAAKRQSEKTAN